MLCCFKQCMDYGDSATASNASPKRSKERLNYLKLKHNSVLRKGLDDIHIHITFGNIILELLKLLILPNLFLL